MKRLTALALTLVVLLLLFLTGCADTKQNGDRLQDKLNTKQLPETQEPAQTDPPDTTQTPTSGKTPSKGSTAQRPGKPGPEEGAPSGDGYSMYEGIYVDDQTDADITTVLELHAYSDILLLEYSYLSDGILSGTWVEEFWPDPDIIADGELVNVCGAYQGFNIIEGTCDYWSEATPCTIVLTEDGVWVQEKGYEYKYRRDESLPCVHTSFDSQMARLRNRVSGQPSAELAGEWEYNDGLTAAYLHLGEDGSFSYVCKEQHRPIEVLEGAWVLDSDSDCLAVQAERIGDETIPYELLLDYSAEGGGLFLMDTTELPGIYLNYGMVFWPAAGQWSTGFTMEQLTSVYYESMNVSGTVAVSEGFDDYEMYYSYRIPCFFSEDSATLDQINSDIRDRFETLAETELDRLSRNEPPVTHMIESYYTAFDGVEQLILWTDSYYELPECAVYCYDRERDMRLDTKALLKRLGISESDFLAAVRVAAEAYFQADNGFMTQEQRQEMGYDERLAWTLSDEVINLDMPVVVTECGELAVIARIGAFAAFDYYYATLYPFSDAVG